MIRDQAALEEIRRSWQGVEALRVALKVSANTSMIGVGGVFPHKLADAANNLPFIHAAAVLNDTLKQLVTEGTIASDKNTLGHLVRAASDKLPWQDLPTIWEAVDKRTEVAHFGKLVPRGDCWRYIGAIERELRAWGVLS